MKDYSEFLVEEQEELNALLNMFPFDMRRKTLTWKQVLDENKKVLKHPKYTKICDLTIEQLHKILLEEDYEDNTNYDITLKTIWEEYHYRKNNHIK